MKSKLEIPIVNARQGADWLQANTVPVFYQRLIVWRYSQSNHNINAIAH